MTLHFLVSFIAKTFLISALGCAAAGVARRQRASVRHAMLTAMFGLLLFLPLIAWLAPPLPLRLLPHTTLPAASVFAFDSPALPAMSVMPAGVQPASPASSPVTWFLLVWMSGALVCLLSLPAAWMGSLRLRREGRSWESMRRHVAERARAARIRRPVKVLLHTELSGPLTCGTLRPSVLLPLEARGWDEADLERALIHELEHIRRADCFTQGLARAVCALYWFNPLVWMARRRMALEAECACDDAVLQHSDSTAYASQLVRAARRMTPAARAAHLAMAGHSDLGRRVRALLDSRQPRGQTGALTLTSAALTAALLAFVIAPATLARAQASPAAAEAASALPSFDTVSVKPFAVPRGHGWHRTPQVDPRRIYIEGMTLHDMILYAYGINNNQLTGLPAWAVRTFFSVTGVTGKPATEAQMRLMLQRVLEQRFQFSFVVANVMQPVHALVVAPGGLKIQRWTSGQDCLSAVDAAERQEVPKLPRPVLVSFEGCSISGLVTKLNGNGRPADGLPVIDKTGLTGLYPMWVWQRVVPSGPGQFRREPFQEAVQRELGLELVKATAPYRVLHAKTIARPAAN